jgi:hypothetical protein
MIERFDPRSALRARIRVAGERGRVRIDPWPALGARGSRELNRGTNGEIRPSADGRVSVPRSPEGDVGSQNGEPFICRIARRGCGTSIHWPVVHNGTQHALARIMFAKVGLDHGPLDQLAKLLDVAETHAQKAPFHLKRFTVSAKSARSTRDRH